MKKRIAALLAVCIWLLCLVLTSCGEKDSASGHPIPAEPEEQEELAVQMVQPTEEPKDDQNTVSEASPQENSSQAASQASSSASSTVDTPTEPFVNPAYDDDDKPVYTISLTNTATKQIFSASCSYADQKEEYAYVSFFLGGGEYETAVYAYNEAKDKGDPIAQGSFNNDISESERRTVRVKYFPDTGKIEAVPVKSTRTQ